MNIQLTSKLPDVGTTIFSRMSALAQQHDALNLSQGFPDFPAPLALCEALARHTMEGHNQYAPMIGEAALRQQIASQLSYFREVDVNPDTEITVVPGATNGLFCAFMALINSGDEVILFDPSYDSYDPAIRLAGGHPVHLPLTSDSFAIDWQRVEDALSPRTRMIVINSPHNPSGSVLEKADLLALQKLVCEHNLLVVSDEVYEHLVFDDHRHHSVLQFAELRSRSVAIFSFGKTYGVTGWKTGYCIAAPEITAELRRIHQFNNFVGVTPMQLALADFMAAEPDYPASLRASYQRKRDILADALAPSRFRLQASAGTYFQLLDFSAISDESDVALSEKWTIEQGIASIPVSVFYQNPPPSLHYLRLCFAKRDEVLLEAAKILCEI